MFKIFFFLIIQNFWKISSQFLGCFKVLSKITYEKFLELENLTKL